MYHRPNISQRYWGELSRIIYKTDALENLP